LFESIYSGRTWELGLARVNRVIAGVIKGDIAELLSANRAEAVEHGCLFQAAHPPD
jgi:hypothetical protein